MNKAEVIKGIEMTISGLETLKKAFSADEVVSKKIEAPVVTGDVDVDRLNSMKYNEFKTYAASLGVKCTGTREEIMKRILEHNEGVAMNAPEEPVEEPVKEEPKKRGRKPKAEVVPKVEKDEFDEQAESIANETSIEDIISALADVDVKATKRNAVSKLAQALRDGLIDVDEEDEDEDEDDDEDIDEEEYDEDDESEDDEDEDESDDDDDEEDDEDEEDDDEDDEDESDEEDDEEGEDIEADSYFPEFDPDGLNNPDDMTDERKDAIVEKMDEILTDISEDKLSLEDIEKYLEEHATEDEIDLLGDEYTDEEELKLYMELVKRTIDNDGEEHTEEEDPYEIGDSEMCCGHKLKYIKKLKKYVCERCSAEYEAE